MGGAVTGAFASGCRLRGALRAYAPESDDPAQVLSKLDRKVRHLGPGRWPTVVRVGVGFAGQHHGGTTVSTPVRSFVQVAA
ncbi:hypothetical protein [Amycolatopsis lurida]|uniref:hypothetical protein n=1 Tax=Amycolatopsis lurida TaxID=31959 RepID=UPI0036574A7A